MAQTFVADEKTASAMALAFLKWQYKQTRTVLIYTAVLVFFIILAFERSLSIPSIVLAIVVLTLTPLLIYRRLKKLFSAHMAKPGSTISVKTDKETLTILMPEGTSTVKFSAYKGLSLQDDFVILKAGNQIGVVLPRQLLPDDALVLIRAAIAKNNV